MTSNLFVSCFVVCALLVNTVAVCAQEKASNEDLIVEFLKFEAGIWDATMDLYMQPDAPPQKFKAEQTDVLGCTGKWLITDLKLVDDGDNPAPPYAGHGVLGYDPNQEKFVGSWVDSRQDAVGICEGTLDKRTNTLTLEVRIADVPTMRFVTKKLDENRKQLTIYGVNPDGDDVVAAVINYQRRSQP